MVTTGAASSWFGIVGMVVLIGGGPGGLRLPISCSTRRYCSRIPALFLASSPTGLVDGPKCGSSGVLDF